MDSIATSLPLIALAYALGGFVKGVIGIGMPLIIVPILSLTMPVPSAIALVSIPVLVSNLVQVAELKTVLPALGRFRWLLIALVPGAVIGASLLMSLDQHQLYLVLGAALLLFSLLGLVPVPEGRVAVNERLWNPLAGFGIGIVGGLSSFPGPPLVLYFMWLRVDKDVFVGTSASVYFLTGVPLMVTLVAHGTLGWREALISTLGLVPLLAGMRLGAIMRSRLSQVMFRRIMLAAVAVIALELLRRGAM
ncbi:sulfite exporter TauE/SafE family protein [Xanthobacter pseudotagetidis]|uniref:sulfite exporter TauE/SafE family protein n=1 Tax=Xanthobacter pseudotagetidis TaxID=3119911 RepID=UPI00372BE8C3